MSRDPAHHPVSPRICIWWLDGASQEFCLYIVTMVRVLLYAQREVFTLPFTLFVLSRGVVARRDKILREGAVWGEDQVLLNSWKLLDHCTCVSLTFVEVFTLHRDQLELALERFPEDARQVHRAYVRLAFKGAIWHHVKSSQGLAKGRPKFLDFLGSRSNPVPEKSNAILNRSKERSE